MKKAIVSVVILVALLALPVVFIGGCAGCGSKDSASMSNEGCPLCAKGVAHKHYTCKMCGGDTTTAGKCPSCGATLVEKEMKMK